LNHHLTAFGVRQRLDFRADCRICNCDRICRTCHDNVDHLYDYDDDEWIFDDDTLGLVDGDDDDDDVAATQTVPAAQPLDEEDEEGTEIHAASPVLVESNVDTRDDDREAGDDDDNNFIPGQGQQPELIIGVNGMAMPESPPPPVLNIIDADGPGFDFDEEDNTDDKILGDEDRR
jgi:hypothetical protein